MCLLHVSRILILILLDGYVRLVCCALTLHVNRFMWWLIWEQFQLLPSMVKRYARPVTLHYLLLLLSQFGEYFGYSLAAPDLNGDGWVSETVLLHHSTPLSSAMMIWWWVLPCTLKPVYQSWVVSSFCTIMRWVQWPVYYQKVCDLNQISRSGTIIHKEWNCGGQCGIWTFRSLSDKSRRLEQWWLWWWACIYQLWWWVINGGLYYRYCC